MANGRESLIKLHGIHFKIWGCWGHNLSNFMKMKKMLWFSTLSLSRDLRKESGTWAMA